MKGSSGSSSETDIATPLFDIVAVVDCSAAPDRAELRGEEERREKNPSLLITKQPLYCNFRTKKDQVALSKKKKKRSSRTCNYFSSFSNLIFRT